MAPRKQTSWRVLALTLLTLASGSAACNVVLGIEAAETVDTLSGAGGAGADCIKDTECNDDNPCTTDRCASGSCRVTPNDRDLPEQVSGDCQTARCVNGSLVDDPDDADLPFDGSDCTEDVCNGGVASNPTLTAGTSCASNGGNQCDGGGQCVGCISNADCNGPETCGGGGMDGFCGCAPTITCASEGLSCGTRADNGCGTILNCDDSMTNGDETDVDCGGPTVQLGGTCDVRCQTGASCTQNIDCVSGVCNNNSCT